MVCHLSHFQTPILHMKVYEDVTLHKFYSKYKTKNAFEYMYMQRFSDEGQTGCLFIARSHEMQILTLLLQKQEFIYTYNCPPSQTLYASVRYFRTCRSDIYKYYFLRF